MKLVTTKAKNIFDEKFFDEFSYAILRFARSNIKRKDKSELHTAQLYFRTNLFYLYTCMCKMGKNRIGGFGKKHSSIVPLGCHYTVPFLHSFIFFGCKALFSD